MNERAVEVAVVGGGPAGLMAAEVLATAGHQVTVYERMPSVGRKLLLAGRGGLNLTHSEAIARLLDRYGPARPRLEGAIDAFGPGTLRAWAEGLGEPTFVGSSGRVFPTAFRATPLLRSWLARLDALGVERRVRHTWAGWDDDGVLRFVDASGASTRVEARATVLALGGASWPRVGSDGAWVPTVEASGVVVAPLRPANCGFVLPWSAPFGDRFAGTPVKNIRLRFGRHAARGDLMVTATGIEGGPVYALSAALRDAIDSGADVVATVDLLPDVTTAELADRLRGGRPRDSTSNVLRRAGLSPVGIGLLREASGRELDTDADALAALTKAVPLPLLAAQPLARAISTAGGIAFDELDDHFMLRRRPGTFVAGEMLDWEAPTGGYLLQATFSTAVAAANGARGWLERG
jgi:uncharacterized flavoprotein (TIGR03862 family)